MHPARTARTLAEALNSPLALPLAQWVRIRDEGGWPFQRLCDRLTVDMLDPAWEVRHGACLALREVLGAQAAAAAVQAPVGSQPAGWLIPGTPGGSWGQLATHPCLRCPGEPPRPVQQRVPRQC